jgi:hypothetical protein
MPFGKQKIDPFEEMRKTTNDIVDRQLQINTAQAQTDISKQSRSAIGGILDTYKRGITGATPTQERVLAGQTLSDLLSVGTPEAHQAAEDFTNFQKIKQVPRATNEFEGLVDKYGGDETKATDEYNKLVTNRIQERKATRNRTPYNDFAEGYPDTPAGRKQSAEDFIKLQTAQAIKKTNTGTRKVSTKTVATKDKDGLMVWSGVDSNGQPFIAYPKVKTTWEDWMKMTEGARQKAIDAMNDLITKSMVGAAGPGSQNPGAATDTSKAKTGDKEKIEY